MNRFNPYGAAMALAARRPRLVFLLGGSVLSMLAIVLLIAVSSIQAFLMISQQSATNNQVGFSPVPQLGDVGLVGDAAVALAAGGLGLVTGGAAGALLGGDAAATGGSTTQRQTTDAAAAPTAPVTADEVVSVYGIRVHTSIAEDLRDLIDHAAADGIVLSGWGWRDNATQIRLRREHCGTSDYAIYQMPSSQCRPPTARPGRSQHELGLAVDFTYNGGSISTRRNPGFQWLQANAATYGLKNLASEPWHWSTTGR